MSYIFAEEEIKNNTAPTSFAGSPINETNPTGALVTWGRDETLDDNIGIYFDIITDHSISIANGVTDNYTEDNTAIHDVIAHAPIECSLNGLVAELVYVPSTNNERFLNRFYNLLNTKDGKVRDYVVTDKLSAIGQLYPPVDNITQLAKNAAVYIEDSIDRYIKIFKNIKRNMNDATRLEEVFNKLLELRNKNIALVYTSPFGVLENMYITNLEFNQGNENHVAEISISMKQLKFATSRNTTADPNVVAKYRMYTQAQVENNGKADGKNESALHKMVKNK